MTVIILVALHAANPDKHGPAGGSENLKNVAFLLGGLGDCRSHPDRLGSRHAGHIGGCVP